MGRIPARHPNISRMRTVENLERPLPLKSSEGVDVAGVLVELVLDRTTFSFFLSFLLLFFFFWFFLPCFFFVSLWRAYRDVAPLLGIPEDTRARGRGKRGGGEIAFDFYTLFYWKALENKAWV